MGGARNLKLGGNGEQGAQGAIILCVGQMSTLFGCCVHVRCSGVHRQSAWSERSKPLKLKHFYLLDVQWKAQICLLFRPPETVVPRRPYVLLLFIIFFQREISEVRGPISAKFCHMFQSMFNL